MAFCCLADADRFQLMSRYPLGMSGHDTRIATDAESALEQARALLPEATLDVGLPNVSGDKLARLIREVPGIECVRLVAITSFSDAKTNIVHVLLDSSTSCSSQSMLTHSTES